MENGLNVEIFENVFISPDDIFQRLENEITYLPPEDCQVIVKGKSYPIPRQLVAFGDSDLTYSFSGLTVKSQRWTPLLQEIKTVVENLSGDNYNFVLVNRYQDGNSHIGQHKDSENDLDEKYTISSLSFGETRTIVFKRKNFDDQKFELKSNTLLLMKPPTNTEWSHGIPKQKKRTGVRINLTFRKIIRPNQKRKHEDDSDKDVKQAKQGESKNRGVFKEDEIPEGVFSIGDCVFAFPSTFRGEVSFHIRKFKKYGKTYYPTAEGVTLRPDWAKFIVSRKDIPKSPADLSGSFFMPENQLKISSTDFESFTFLRTKYAPDDKFYTKSIVISKSQWTEMLNNCDDIVTAILDHVFSAMDFLNAYNSITEQPIENSLPNTLDVSLGTQYLLQVLQTVFCDLLKEKGLQMSEVVDCGEVWGHRIETFNSTAFLLDIKEISESFYHRLWSDQHFLSMKPVMYVSNDFLKTVHLNQTLKDVRNLFCPSNAFEFFEDLY